MSKKRKKRRKGVTPEPGAWLLNLPGGMPDVCPPDPLPAGQISADTVREQVLYEGLGFCVLVYIPDCRIEDLKLRALWGAARTRLRAIQRWLEEDYEARELRKRLESCEAS